MRVHPISVVAAAILGSPSFGQAQVAAGPGAWAPVLPPQAMLELLTDIGSRTEGPATTSVGTAYFVDLDLPNGGRIWRWDPEAREARVIRSPSGMAAGLAIGQDGTVLTAELASRGRPKDWPI